MGKRLIFCRVDDEYLRGAGQLAGAVGSHDDIYLRIQFGGMWAGMSKYVTFKDALGEHPTKVWLLPSLLVEDAPEVYDVPIPQSAKAVRGNMMVTVTGYGADETGKTEESLTNTVTAYFKILEADAADGEDASVTLTLAQQVAAMLDKFNAAEKVRVEHETGREAAEAVRAAAEGARTEAEQGRESAEDSRVAAETTRATAEAARGDAEKARDEAEKRREDAGEGIVARAKEMARWAQEEAECAARHAEDAEAEANHAEDFARMAKADSMNAESEAAKAADLADDAEESYVKAFDEATRAAGEADRAKAEADRAATAGKSPYEAAVEAGYTGTEAEFYAALVALKDGPFLPLSGGDIVGDFAVYGKNANRGEIGDLYGPRAVLIARGDLDKTDSFAMIGGKLESDVVQISHLRAGESEFVNPVYFGGSLNLDDISPIYSQSGADFDGGVSVGDGLEVRGGVEVRRYQTTTGATFDGSINIEGNLNCNAIKVYDKPGNIGDVGFRFNTLYSKKVDASEWVMTPKFNAPSDLGYIKFMVRQPDKDVISPIKASPNPLPVQWGGTGLSRAMTPNDIGAASNPNLLDNWCFMGGGSQQGGGQFPINQRVATEYSGLGYGIDRWICGHNAGKVTVLPDGVLFEQISQGNAAFMQKFDQGTQSYILGKEMTLSFLADTSEVIGDIALTGLASDGGNAFGYARLSGITPGINLLSATAIVSQTGKYGVGLYLYGTAEGLSKIKILAAKLELGDTQTLAHQDVDGNWVLNDPPPNVQQEQAKCQRYQVAFAIEETIGIVHAYDTNAAYFTIFLPTTLRGNPTIDPEKLVVMTQPYLSAGGHPTGVYNLQAIPNGVAGFLQAPGLVAGEKYYLACRPATTESPCIIDANL